ncbi:hypothetical protein [Planctomicrobium piriforme]|uniref:hypothetical protein n=1 Tax=Planctomicrobium piriforme TaxID=1576369 RepID=UPI00111455E1|nr:hypothetical protein [Planctomicrobium piriforme]
MSVAIGLPVQAQQPQAGHDHAGHAHGAHEHGGETLAYRLPQWKEMHFDDAQKAEQHLQAVQKLGCEVRKDSHAGHTDVVYRCPDWKSINVANHDLAHQWEGWMKTMGFDYSHGHVDAALTQGPESLEYRLTEWKTIHAEATAAGDITKLVATLKSIGCEVRDERHEGHADISYRSPIWRDIHFANHQSAQQWQSWLQANGFEARHEH